MAYITEWFKVIQDGQLIGVATDQSFARYSSKSGRVHICKAIEGQYLVLNDKYYRDDWMLAVDPECYIEYENATVISIKEKEFDILNKLDYSEPINATQLINTEPEDIPVKAPKETEVATIDAVRKWKLAELSIECELAIENGFSLVLSDGATHHFSLSFEDQINLLHLERAMSINGDLIYHADGELMQYFSEEDAQMVIEGAKRWKLYNTTLYNSLKNWINDIDNIEDLEAVKYDSAIPEKYCTTVLQTLTENF